MTEQLRKACWKRQRVDKDVWNERNPVGTAVRYYPTEGRTDNRVTQTKSVAFDTNAGVMIFLGCQGGSHLLSHVDVLDGSPDQIERLLREEEAREAVHRFAREVRSIGAGFVSVADRLHLAAGRETDFAQIRTQLEKAFVDLSRGFEKALGRLQ